MFTSSLRGAPRAAAAHARLGAPRSAGLRGFATPPPGPGQQGPQGNPLWRQFGVGFVLAAGTVVAYNVQQRVFARDSLVHCDAPTPAPPRSKPVIEGNTRLVGDAPIIARDREDGETMTRRAGEVARSRKGNAKDEHPAIIHEEDDPNNPMRIRMSQYVMHLQDTIVAALERIEASVPPTAASPSFTAPTFHRDHWLRPQGGEGSSCVLAGGRVFEKAGVNVSVVHGTLPPAAVRQMKADHKSLTAGDQALPFFAAGISIVLHPWNPHAPTVHMNYRYFEVDQPGAPADAPPLAWWFGGGSDLTPSYLYPEDAEHFHCTLRDAAARHDARYYPAWKQWCDKYFWITHRGEARGVGGIFFDDLTSSSEIHAPGGDSHAQPSQDDVFALVRSMGASFLPSYLPILRRRIDTPSTDQERRWQLMRRGRYVEFNLVHDRGTKFGLMTPGARIESILMSLPETARWEYMSDMGAKGSGTREEELLEVLREPRVWA